MKIRKSHVFIIIAAVLAVTLFSFWWSDGLRRKLALQTVDSIHDLAVNRMRDNAAHGSGTAAEFIDIPIEVTQISPDIFQVTGVANTHVISTPQGNVMFDTGLSLQVPKQMEVLQAAVPKRPLTHIIVSHSHADHTGGVKFWRQAETEIITHVEFIEEQRYLTELQPYFYARNRLLFPFMPENPPTLEILKYGGIEPTITIADDETYEFELGGRQFEVMAMPGAEGADNIVLWLPESKILFSGDFFGPIFPQFPNVFTMRGEKIRKPVEYIQSLNRIIELDPEMIVPSHLSPVTDKQEIMAGLVRIRDAVAYVHDRTVAGMNEGKTLHELMAEISLPPELELTQIHGRVSWAVKSIWQYYATWFHFDRTTALYAVPQHKIYGDIVELGGIDGLVSRAERYLADGQAVAALHLLEIVTASATGRLTPDMAVSADMIPALNTQKKALQVLLQQAENGLGNSYEIYWLTSQIRMIDALTP